MTIYAQVHSYTNGAGATVNTIATRLDQPDGSWFPFEVADHTWLYLDGNNAIQVYTQDQVNTNLSAAQWPAYQAQAQAALDKSDTVAIRCLKAGVAFPAEWQSYVAALRTIVAAATGNPSVPLPTQPAYPAGT